jgi:hypothetical protein
MDSSEPCLTADHSISLSLSQSVMKSIEVEQQGNIRAALHGLEESITQISFVRASSFGELSGRHTSLVDAVCGGIISTISNRVQVRKA